MSAGYVGTAFSGFDVPGLAWAHLAASLLVVGSLYGFGKHGSGWGRAGAKRFVWLPVTASR
jgi:hypothetical protein